MTAEATNMAEAATIEPTISVAPDAEDVLRANLYRLLARFLGSPPCKIDLATASSLSGDSSDLGKVITTFGAIAKDYDQADAVSEHQELFVGMVRGELLPFASYYLTGFLHEKPLAKLRNSLAELGIERDPNVKEPEDHIAALMEVMAGLIVGEFGNAASVEAQKEFFETHIGPWADYFFADLEEQETSELYAALGSIGRRFLEIEETAFQMN